MYTSQKNYRNTQSSHNPARQRGFFSVGVGLGLAALYGVIAGVVVAKHQPDETNMQASAQQIEAPLQTSAYQPDYPTGNIFPGESYE